MGHSPSKGLALALVVALAMVGCYPQHEVPSPPSPTVEPTATPIQPDTVPAPASISGAIRTDQDTFYALRVYAREVHTGQVRWIETQDGDRTYAITQLPPGTYVVIGWYYPAGVSGAYTSLETILATGADAMRACEGAITQIELAPGEEYSGADIGCWEGTFLA